MRLPKGQLGESAILRSRSQVGAGCLPFDNMEDSNASVQAKDFEALRSWSKPVHFIWGLEDDIFTETWGRKWAGMYDQATFDGLEAGHFLQETHGPEIVEILLRGIGDE